MELKAISLATLLAVLLVSAVPFAYADLLPEPLNPIPVPPIDQPPPAPPDLPDNPPADNITPPAPPAKPPANQPSSDLAPLLMGGAAIAVVVLNR